MLVFDAFVNLDVISIISISVSEHGAHRAELLLFKIFGMQIEYWYWYIGLVVYTNWYIKN